LPVKTLVASSYEPVTANDGQPRSTREKHEGPRCKFCRLITAENPGRC
jgi:hypothetical protein